MDGYPPPPSPTSPRPPSPPPRCGRTLQFRLCVCLPLFAFVCLLSFVCFRLFAFVCSLVCFFSGLLHPLVRLVGSCRAPVQRAGGRCRYIVYGPTNSVFKRLPMLSKHRCVRACGRPTVCNDARLGSRFGSRQQSRSWAGAERSAPRALECLRCPERLLRLPSLRTPRTPYPVPHPAAYTPRPPAK
jgi:hypothetical protein